MKKKKKSDFGGFRQISIFDFQVVAKNGRMNQVLQILANFLRKLIW
jgi:hypothetical protein